MVKVRSRSIVEITLEVCPNDSWGADCKIDQVQKQAAASAIGMLQEFISKSNNKIKIKGRPEVTAVLIEEE